MLPLALVLRKRPPPQAPVAAPVTPAASRGIASTRPLGLHPNLLLGLLCVAGVSCCVAMSMPQVHIVAYCGDLGFGAARGAEMLSLMLAMGVVSRLVSGWISDRIGGLRTLLLGSLLQGLALLMFLPSDGLVSLYVVSGMFGLFQGGIVPAYALIVREYFPPGEAGAKVGTVLMATLFGMALGGWLSGAVFDWTGSYRAAFINGIAWNLLNLAIVSFLLWRAGGVAARTHPALQTGSPLGGFAKRPHHYGRTISSKRSSPPSSIATIACSRTFGLAWYATDRPASPIIGRSLAPSPTAMACFVEMPSCAQVSSSILRFSAPSQMSPQSWSSSLPVSSPQLAPERISSTLERV
jgi:MFS family permease